MTDALIAALGKATGPDRELDAEIFRAIGAPVPFQWLGKVAALSYDEKQKCWCAPIGDMQLRFEHPHYTASIDAAMGLIPSNRFLFLEQRKDGWTAMLTHNGSTMLNKTKGQSAPCCISAAALKAIAAQRGGG